MQVLGHGPPKFGFRTLTLLSSKGGTGKTTLAVQLAVMAEAQGLEPVLLDCDPQKSASDWARARGQSKPQVVRLRPNMLGEFHTRLMRSEVRLLIIDTPPSGGPDIAEALRLSDLSLLVCRPAALDIWAVDRAADLARRLSYRAEFIINQAPPRRAGKESPTVLDAAEKLRAYGLPVAPIGLRSRVDYSNALREGQAVTEYAPSSVAAKELGLLWAHIEEALWAPRASVGGARWPS